MNSLYNLLIKYHMKHSLLNIDDKLLLSLLHSDHKDILKSIMLYLQ